MSQEDSQQEPTMEEILASIRRIISEDEEEQDGSLDEAVVNREGFDTDEAGEAEAAGEDDFESMAADDLGDMGDVVDEDMSAVSDDIDDIDDMGDLGDIDDLGDMEDVSLGSLEDDDLDSAIQDDDVLELTDRVEEPVEDEFAVEDVEPEPEPVAAVEDDIEFVEDSLGAEEEDSLLSTEAAGAAAASFGALAQNIAVSRGQGRTLEELVQQMLQPMLKDWLDNNLPPMVEDLVREEIERIAKRSSRR